MPNLLAISREVMLAFSDIRRKMAFLMAFICAVNDLKRLVVDGCVNQFEKKFQSLQKLILVECHNIVVVGFYAETIFQVGNHFLQPHIACHSSIFASISIVERRFDTSSTDNSLLKMEKPRSS